MLGKGVTLSQARRPDHSWSSFLFRRWPRRSRRWTLRRTLLRISVTLSFRQECSMKSIKGRPNIASTPTDRKSTRLNSSHGYISYAVFCLKKKKEQQEHWRVCVQKNMTHIADSGHT